MNSSTKKSSLLAIIDQVLLSLLGLVASIAVAKYSGKEQFGAYTLQFSIVLLIQGIQNSMWFSPLVALISRPIDDDAKAAYKISAFRGSVLTILVLSCAAAIVSFMVGNRIGGGVGQITILIAVCVASMGATLRDGLRAENYAEGRSDLALRFTMIAAIIQVIAIFYLVMFELMTANAMLITSGVSLAIAWLIVATGSRASKKVSVFSEFTKFSKWTLPSVGVSWGGGNIQNYFVARDFGVSTVAEVNAARLFLMPVGVAVTAWSNYFRPRIMKNNASGKKLEAQPIVNRSLLACIFFIPVYGAVVGWLSSFSTYLLGEDYRNLGGLVFGWAICFSLMAARVVFFTGLSSDERGVKTQFYFGLVGFVVAILSMLFFLSFGALGVVISMCLIEVTQIGLYFAFGRSK